MSLYKSCNIVYGINSNSPHITFPFYPQIPLMAARLSRAAITPIPPRYCYPVEKLHKRKSGWRLATPDKEAFM